MQVVHLLLLIVCIQLSCLAALSAACLIQQHLCNSSVAPFEMRHGMQFTVLLNASYI